MIKSTEGYLELKKNLSITKLNEVHGINSFFNNVNPDCVEEITYVFLRNAKNRLMGKWVPEGSGSTFHLVVNGKLCKCKVIVKLAKDVGTSRFDIAKALLTR